MTHISCLDEIRNIFQQFPTACIDSEAVVMARNAHLAKPQGSLGKLEHIARHYARWQGKSDISIAHPRISIFMGSHGVDSKLDSPYTIAHTVERFRTQGAGVNALCKLVDADLRVYEMRLEHPTSDFTNMPAMSESDCVHAISYGMTTVEPGVDTVCVGEIGIGNTPSTSALAYALFGDVVDGWNVCDGDVAKRAVALHYDAITTDGTVDGLKALQHLGGYEMCATVGAIIAGRMAGVPIILDGYATCVAAACLYAYDPSYLDHCLVGDVSGDSPHRQVLDIMEKTPVLNVGVHLGEATGATLALLIVKGAIACHMDMATTEEIDAHIKK